MKTVKKKVSWIRKKATRLLMEHHKLKRYIAPDVRLVLEKVAGVKSDPESQR